MRSFYLHQRSILLVFQLGYVQTIPDNFCAATKIIPARASVHTQERLWRRDFCDGERLRHADF